MKKEPKIVRIILEPTIVVVWVHVIGVMVDQQCHPTIFQVVLQRTQQSVKNTSPYHTNKSRNSVIASSYQCH